MAHFQLRKGRETALYLTMLNNQSFGLKFVTKLLKANNLIPTPPNTPHSLTMISSKKLNIFIIPRNVKRTFRICLKSFI